MVPEGRYLAQGEQHERPPVHFRMGQLQLAAAPPSVRVADLPAAVIENIDIELARPPVTSKPATGRPLDAFEISEESGRGHRPFGYHNPVQINGLTAQTDRGGGVKRRKSQDPKTNFSKLA
jgi:hypothetical protein